MIFVKFPNPYRYAGFQAMRNGPTGKKWRFEIGLWWYGFAVEWGNSP